MRHSSVRPVLKSFALFALPLAVASCTAATPDPGSPVPAQLTDRQAAVLARGHLDAKPVAWPRTFVAEEKQPHGWWLRYEGPFDATAKPPQASYLVEVDNNGSVRDVQ
jgi:hypothetical protein